MFWGHCGKVLKERCLSMYSQEKENTRHEAVHRVIGYWEKPVSFSHICCPGYAGPMMAQVFWPLEVCVWEEEREEASLALSNRSFSFGWRSPHTSPIWGMKLHNSHSVNSAKIISWSINRVGVLLETHLFVPLYLWVDKCPQYWSHKWQIGEDQLGFLMQTQKGEISPHLHGDNCVLLL